MNATIKTFSFAALIACAMLLFAGTLHAQVPDVDIVVKRAGGTEDDSTRPKNPTTLNEETSPLGAIIFRVKNQTGKAATDVHLRVIEPEDAKITEVDIGLANWDEAHPSALPAKEMGAEADSLLNELANGSSISLSLTFSRPLGTDPETYEGLDQEEVEYEIWFTAGNANEVIHAVSPDTIGDVDDGDALTTVGIPSYDDSWAVADTTDTSILLFDIAIAERHGFRFQNGDLLIKPTGGYSFKNPVGVTLLAYEQGGDEASESDIDLGPVRIDDMGNLVFSVERRPAHAEHVVIVVRGATLDTPDGGWDGEEIFVDVQCSALAGFVLEDFKKVAKFEDD